MFETNAAGVGEFYLLNLTVRSLGALRKRERNPVIVSRCRIKYCTRDETVQRIYIDYKRRVGKCCSTEDTLPFSMCVAHTAHSLDAMFCGTCILLELVSLHPRHTQNMAGIKRHEAVHKFFVMLHFFLFVCL